MDPDGKWTSTRAVLLAAAGQNRWPPAGSYMAATGQDLMAADSSFRSTMECLLSVRWCQACAEAVTATCAHASSTSPTRRCANRFGSPRCASNWNDNRTNTWCCGTSATKR